MTRKKLRQRVEADFPDKEELIEKIFEDTIK